MFRMPKYVKKITLSFFSLMSVLVIAGIFSCVPPELDLDSNLVFKLDNENNIVFTPFKSSDEKQPDFRLIVKAVKTVWEPESFEILTLVPLAKKELVLVTRKHGLLHTNNLGETWERIDTGLLPQVVYPFEDHGLTKPVIGVSVSRDKRRVAVLFSESLFLSRDGGKTFVRAPLNNASTYVEYLCVAWHPDNEKLLLLGTAQVGTTANCGVYYSADGGENVVGIDRGLPGEPTRYPNYLEEVRAVCFGSDEDVFFAGLGNGNGVYQGSVKERVLKKLDEPELYTYPDGDFYRVESLYFERGKLFVTTNRSWKKVITVQADESAKAGNLVRDLFLAHDKLISFHTAEGSSVSLAGAHQPKRKKSPDERVMGKRALYISYTFTQRENYDKLVALLRELGLNAVVLNLKDDYGCIRVETNDPLLKQVPGAVSPYVNVAETIAKLKKDGIYVIGRMVCFKDEPLYKFENYKYAIKYANGAPLQKGPEKWVDAYSEFVWDYNIAAAQAIVAAGADEIQFDYIRFPDLKGELGKLARYDFKRENQIMREALVSFLIKARSALTVPVSIDVFGYQGIYKFGQWIGQDVTELAPYVDAVSPMFYPSHYTGGYAISYGSRRIYYTIYLSCKRAHELIGDTVLRPYIQAFYYKDNEDNYGVDYIGWELDGLQDSGTRDFILWNDLSEYVTLIRGMRKYQGKGEGPLPQEITAVIPKKLPFSSVLVIPE